MKVLYISGTYYPATGGAEKSAYTLMEKINEKESFEAAVLTDKRYSGNEYGTKMFFTDHEEREESIEDAMNEFEPDVVFAQLMWSDVAVKKSRENGLPSVLRVCKVPFERDISKNSVYGPTKIVSNSAATKEFVKENFGRNSTIIQPPVDIQELKDNFKGVSGDYITLFNPIVRKGGNVFKKLAEEMPEKSFSVVKGWDSLKEDGSGEFSEKYLSRISESIKDYGGETPKEVDMRDLENVDYLEPRMNVSEIYEKTCLLLVPSQWEETFGRVALEAMSLGIPVIASKVGGLKDVVGIEDLLVEEFDDPEKWREKVNRVLDEENYDYFKERCLEKADEYSLEKIVGKYESIFKQVCK